MVWRIAKKEILSNLLTLRFSVGIILFLVLVALFVSVLIGNYQQKLKAYDERVTVNNNELRQLMTYQNLKPTVYKPPELFELFSKGVGDSMGNSTRISIREVPEIESAAATKNPLLSVFPLLDVALIFKLVISVLALLFAYDAISGEKENGTLALMLSNSVPRHQVLFGKFIGGMITLTIPITIGFLMSGLILEFSPMVKLTDADWARIGLMFIVSLIMVSVLFNLGLFLSSVTKQSSNTLMLLLFLWVLFVLVIPNGSSYLATQIKPVESREKIDSQVREVWNQFGEEVNDFKHSLSNLRGGYTIQSDATEPWGYYHKFATKNLIRYKQKLNAFAEPLRIRYAQEAWEASKNYLESLKDQKELAVMFSRSSPISVYENLFSGLSRTDLHSFERFASQAREYKRQIIDYLYDKEAFSSIRYVATVKEEHLFDVDSMEEYDAIRKKYCDEDPQPLDVSDLPQFRYRPESVVDTVKRILPDLMLLCAMGVLFFFCAFAAILKYDVR